MKTDYNKIMQKEISSFDGKPKLLLHCCCAPCSSAVIEKLCDFFDITFYFFNPNIFPKEEYDKRGKEFEKLGVKIVFVDYDHKEFLDVVSGHESDPEGGDRCKICIAQRMKKAFEYAKNNNFDVVTTTLSISPHKDCEYINKVGEKFEQAYQIKYLHADFKKENGYLRSIQICKQLGVYRQDYCGCEFAKNKPQN